MRFIRRLTGIARRLRYRYLIWRQPNLDATLAEQKKTEAQSFTYDVTIVAHLYYLDSASEILQAIRSFKYESGLNTQVLLTTSHELESQVSKLNARFNTGAQVFAFDNQGRDVFPFVHLAQKKLLSESALVLKIHTKHPRKLPTGSMLDHSLGLRLLTPELGIKLRHLSATQEFFTTEKNFCLDTNYLGANLNQIKSLAQDVGIDNLPSDFTFPAGTMFWATPSIVEKISQLNLSLNEFSTEPSPADGTVSHAVERLVGVIASVVGAGVLAIEDLNFQSATK
jgi:lipopolysaccharide biosynthesis protein